MTVSHATIAEIRDIVDAFEALSWPSPRAEMVDIADRLGWTVRLDQPSGIQYATAFSFGRTSASILLDDDNLAQATIAVTSRGDEKNPEDRAELLLAYDDVRSILIGMLGEPARTTRGSNPETRWDLANRGRLSVADVGIFIAIVVIQERYAEVERFEEARGVPDDKNPDADY